MLQVSRNLQIPDSEIDLQAIRAQGSGGQNVNKVASAIHLRFDIRASSLPDRYKEKLLALSDQRITSDGVVVNVAVWDKKDSSSKIVGRLGLYPEKDLG